MRALVWTAAAAAGLTLFVAGCQKPQFKVIATLPEPVVGYEDGSGWRPVTPPAVPDPSNPRQNHASPPAQPPQPQPRAAAPTVRPDPGWEVNGASRPWRYIVVHHSGAARGNAAAIDSYHRSPPPHGRGWENGLGYDFVINNGSLSADGLIEVGSRWKRQIEGAHCKTRDNRFNDYGIGICLVGNLDQARPTAAQLASLYRLIAYLAEKYRIPADRIYGHREAVATLHEGGTECPGDNMDMAGVRKFARTGPWVASGN